MIFGKESFALVDKNDLQEITLKSIPNTIFGMFTNKQGITILLEHYINHNFNSLGL